MLAEIRKGDGSTVAGQEVIAIGLALGVGLGALGAGIGIGNIFGSMIQSVARQPELRGELEAIARGLLQPAPLDLRVNTMLAKRDEVLAAFERDSIAAAATRYSPVGVRLEAKPALQRHPPLLDPGEVVLVEAGVDVRRARHQGDPVGDRHPRHLQRGFKIRRTVIDPRKEMAVEIEHGGGRRHLASSLDADKAIPTRALERRRPGGADDLAMLPHFARATSYSHALSVPPCGNTVATWVM